MKKITPNRRLNLINAIEEYLEDNPDLDDWSHGFLEDMQKQWRQGQDFIGGQYPKLLKYISV